jgi:mevalonate kinase
MKNQKTQEIPLQYTLVIDDWKTHEEIIDAVSMVLKMNQEKMLNHDEYLQNGGEVKVRVKGVILVIKELEC